MQILSNFKAVSNFGPKMKVAQKFILYNFAFMTKVKFQIDFELEIKININSKPYFGRLFSKAKFEKTLNIHLAPKCM